MYARELIMSQSKNKVFYIQTTEQNLSELTLLFPRYINSFTYYPSDADKLMLLELNGELLCGWVRIGILYDASIANTVEDIKQYLMECALSS